MSADSQAQGLAQSQQLPNEEHEFEDPGHSWIDLVVAFKSGDPSAVRNMLNLAKASHWNHELFDQLCEDDPDYSDTEEDQAAQSMRSLKQGDIDAFFEE